MGLLAKLFGKIKLEQPSVPRLGIYDLPGGIGTLTGFAPSIVEMLIGRLNRLYITYSNDDIVYLNNISIGYVPYNYLHAEYWLLCDKHDNAEWQIWYQIFENINGLPEAGLSTIIDKNNAEILRTYLDFILVVRKDDINVLDQELSRLSSFITRE